MFGFRLTFRQRLLLSELRDILPMLIVKIIGMFALLITCTFLVWYYGPIVVIVLCGLLLVGLVGVYADTWWKFLRPGNQVPAARRPSIDIASEIASIQDAFNIDEDGVGAEVGEGVDDGEPAHQVGVLNEV